MFDPMKEILSIYEANRDTYTIAHLDDFAPPQCEDRCHNTDPDHHAGAAKYLFITPCCHGNYYVCDTFAIWLTSGPLAHCARCDAYTPLADFSFIPIGGKS